MTFPDRYLDWVEFLMGKKLYGAWIKDVSTYIRFDETRAEQQWSSHVPFISSTYWNPMNVSSLEERKAFTVNKNQYIGAFIGNFDTSDDTVKDIISDFTMELKWSITGGFKPSGVHWTQVYKEFYELRHPKITLSRKLSKKMYRANNKVSSGKYYNAEKEEQPWYNKSYEKYNKKAWRK